MQITIDRKYLYILLLSGTVILSFLYAYNLEGQYPNTSISQEKLKKEFNKFLSV
jgi:hypothetical protein